jgi:hypothetical protein
MAIFNTMRVQPAPRLQRPATYISKPVSALDAEPTAAQVAAVNAAYEAERADTGAATNKTLANPSLVFHVPPAKAVTLTPDKNTLKRYYLYHMAATRVGTAVVKTESTVKVVYMTAAHSSARNSRRSRGSPKGTALFLEAASVRQRQRRQRSRASH